MAVVYRLIVEILTVWYLSEWIHNPKTLNKFMLKINRISYWIVSDKFFVVLV